MDGNAPCTWVPWKEGETGAGGGTPRQDRAWIHPGKGGARGRRVMDKDVHMRRNGPVQDTGATRIENRLQEPTARKFMDTAPNQEERTNSPLDSMLRPAFRKTGRATLAPFRIQQRRTPKQNYPGSSETPPRSPVRSGNRPANAHLMIANRGNAGAPSAVFIRC